MNRLCLRIATKGCLLNGGAVPWPTMAENRWFDSRRENFLDMQPNDIRPVGVIRTDVDFRENLVESQTSDKDLLRRIELHLEFAIWSAVEEIDAENNPVLDEDGKPVVVVGWPATDPALEAMLDLFEYQIDAALFGSNPWAVYWRRYFGRENRTSTPMWVESEEGRVKLAAREIVLAMRAHPDCIPDPVHSDAPEPVGVLPERLTALFDMVNTKGAGEFKAATQQIRSILEAQSLPVGSVYPPLQRVRMTWPEAKTPAGQTPRSDVVAELLEPL